MDTCPKSTPLARQPENAERRTRSTIAQGRLPNIERPMAAGAMAPGHQTSNVKHQTSQTVVEMLEFGCYSNANA